MSLEAAIICLALNDIHEARGERLLGRYAVVHTVRNRAKWNPDNVCKTIFAKSQFSWTLKMNGHNSQQLEQSIHVVRMAWDSPADVSQGANHYHAAHIRPSWAAKMKRTVQIGNHIFYYQR